MKDNLIKFLAAVAVLVILLLVGGVVGSLVVLALHLLGFAVTWNLSSVAGGLLLVALTGGINFQSTFEV